MLQATTLRKPFGDIIAVENVSFVASNGRGTGLLGPNGAGKTTTLRMLYGLLSPDRGQANIDGHNLSSEPLIARRRIGVLSDSAGLYPRLTARENIRYFGQLHGLDGSALEHRIDALADLLDLSEAIDRRTHGFSQGERMKVAIARSLVHDPPNILLDEPTNGLDVMTTRAMREVIRRLADDGRCVLLPSHVMQEITALCDQIVIIDQGRVITDGTPDELRTETGHSNLEDAFVTLIGSERGLVP